MSTSNSSVSHNGGTSVRPMVPAPFRQRRTDYRNDDERMAITVRECLRNAIAYGAKNALIWGLIDDKGHYWFVFSHDGTPFDSPASIHGVMPIAMSGGHGISGSGLKTAAYMLAPCDEDFCLCVQSKCLDGTYGHAVVTADPPDYTTLRIDTDAGMEKLLKDRMGDVQHGRFTVHYMMRAPLGKVNNNDRGGITKNTWIRGAVDYTPVAFEEDDLLVLYYVPPIDGGSKRKDLDTIVSEKTNKSDWNRGDRQLCRIVKRSDFETLYSDRSFDLPFSSVAIEGQTGFTAVVSGEVHLVYFKGEYDDAKKYSSLKIQCAPEKQPKDLGPNDLLNQVSNRYTVSLTLAVDGIGQELPNVNYDRLVEDPVYVKRAKNNQSEMSMLGLPVPTYKESKPYVMMYVDINEVHEVTQEVGDQPVPHPVDVRAIWAIAGQVNEFMLTNQPEVTKAIIKKVLTAVEVQQATALQGIRKYHHTLFPPPDTHGYLPLVGLDADSDARQPRPFLLALDRQGNELPSGFKFQPGKTGSYLLVRADQTRVQGDLTVRVPEVRVDAKGKDKDVYTITVPVLSRYDDATESYEPLDDSDQYDRHCVPRKVIIVEVDGTKYDIRPAVDVPVIHSGASSGTGPKKPRSPAPSMNGHSYRSEDVWYDGTDDKEDLVQWVQNKQLLKLNQRNFHLVRVFHGWDPERNQALYQQCVETYRLWGAFAEAIQSGPVVYAWQTMDVARREVWDDDSERYVLNQVVLRHVKSAMYEKLAEKVQKVKPEGDPQDLSPSGSGDQGLFPADTDNFLTEVFRG